MTQTNPLQRTAEIARRLAALGQQKEALEAYTLLIHQAEESEVELALEGAVYLFQNGGDYKISYSCFCSLYNRGHFREDLFPLMAQAFYLPNVKAQKARYEKNCKLLAKYPYLFRKDFPKFEELPILFFPYDDNGYLTYDPRTDQFGPYTDYSHEVVSRNFFKDLEKPILAADVFSQYELEYLNDNVRKSEWVARDNHIYLHYTDWAIFCAHLQVLNLRYLLEEKKFVFLVGDEITQYPLDFKARFGIDYSQHKIEPLHIREIHRLIWHTQLATHNGGDFFNEIFDDHPNLIIMPSVMLKGMMKSIAKLKEALRTGSAQENISGDGDQEKVRQFMGQLRKLPHRTEKDFFITLMLCMADMRRIDPAERIVPAVFFQPHFSNIVYSMTSYSDKVVTLHSEQYEDIQHSPLFKSFKYIKTFTPVRRVTTSCGASIHFMSTFAGSKDAKTGKVQSVSDNLFQRLLNRSFLIDWQDRLFKDCVMVRFEDGKLNPKATFTALAAFLDLPYTESMTYCSVNGEYNATTGRKSDAGFSTASLQRSYDESLGTPERYVLEYFLQDLYKHCGYDLQYYDGEPMDSTRAESFLDRFTVLDGLIRSSLQVAYQDKVNVENGTEDCQTAEQSAEQEMKQLKKERRDVMTLLLQQPEFVNKSGQPLRMMPLLQLDPALLEQPLYH